MNALNIYIATPEAEVFSGEAQKVTVPGKDGRFQILKDHAPIISTLGKGNVNIDLEGGKAENFSVDGGVVEVLDNKVNILVEKVILTDDQKSKD